MNEAKGYPDSEGLWWFKGQRGIRRPDGTFRVTPPTDYWRPLMVFKGHEQFIEFTPGLYYVVGITIFGPVQWPLHPYNFAGAWIKIEEPKDV